MDRGVMGVQVPHINTAQDARRAIAAVKFGPRAGRGLAAGTRPDNWGLGAKMADFTTAANEQSLVCVQLEHEAAIQNVDEVLKIDGVDVFFIGPSDLSQSMGYPGNPSAPSVAKAITETQAKIVAAGKIAGMPATAANVAHVVGSGVRYIYVHLPKVLAGRSVMSRLILVVEDQEDNRQIIRDLLSALDYELAEAENGAEAVAAVAKQKPDLILMDIQMPIIDGYEATRRIKADPATTGIPIIAVTSYALSGDEQKARDAGCDDYVPKPFSPRQLLAKIRQYLP
jgi:two-component system, cell cycle response regulator DivK